MLLAATLSIVAVLWGSPSAAIPIKSFEKARKADLLTSAQIETQLNSCANRPYVDRLNKSACLIDLREYIIDSISRKQMPDLDPSRSFISHFSELSEKSFQDLSTLNHIAIQLFPSHKKKLTSLFLRSIILTYSPEDSKSLLTYLDEYLEKLSAHFDSHSKNDLIENLQKQFQSDTQVGDYQIHNADIFVEFSSKGWGTLFNGLLTENSLFEHVGLVQYQIKDGFRIPFLIEMGLHPKKSHFDIQRSLIWLRPLQKISVESLSQSLDQIFKQNPQFDIRFGSAAHSNSSYYCTNFVTEVLRQAGFDLNLSSTAKKTYQSRRNFRIMGLSSSFNPITPDQLFFSEKLKLAGFTATQNVQKVHAQDTDELDRSFSKLFNQCSLKTISWSQKIGLLISEKLLSLQYPDSLLSQDLPAVFKMHILRYLMARQKWTEDPTQRSSLLSEMTGWFQCGDSN